MRPGWLEGVLENLRSDGQRARTSLDEGRQVLQAWNPSILLVAQVRVLKGLGWGYSMPRTAVTVRSTNFERERCDEA
jgi:hypothetical protein